jgi:hypothetical protein
MKRGAAVLVCLAWASCGGERQELPEVEVRAAFENYTEGMEARDWDRVCGQMASESIDELRQQTDSDPSKPCPEVWAALYESVGEELADDLTGDMNRTAEIDDIEVDGETATIHWHHMRDGKPVFVSQQARKVEGEWKLIDDLK